MAKNPRSWEIIGGRVVLFGLLMGAAVMAQNAPADQNAANTASGQNAAAGQTDHAAAADQTVAQAATTGQPNSKAAQQGVLVAQVGGGGTAAGTDQTASQAGTQLQEVVVTATHFSTQANQTALSITAITVGSLLQQGINNFSDLAASVPNLNITASAGFGLDTIAIRGIIQTGGAATTGFYLDNTPLQLWADALAGSPIGTPVPPIFDLQRVEVLEGPQGTIFGSMSEGGTIRYITPAPSLDQYHVYAKLDSSQTDDAQGLNYNGGVAVGGPIIPGVLGFRASVYDSHQAGWINAEDPYSQQIFAKGINNQEAQAFQGKLLWQPTANFSVLASLYDSYQSTPSYSASYDESTSSPIVVSELGYEATGVGPNPVCSGNPVSGLPNCATYKGPVRYERPGFTLGPYQLPSNTVVETAVQADLPSNTGTRVPELDLTYTFPSLVVSLYSTYVDENAYTLAHATSDMSRTVYDAQEGSAFIPEGLAWDAAVPDQGYEYGNSTNDRKTLAEDLRFTSTITPSQLGRGNISWTAGAFWEHDWATAHLYQLVAYGQMNSTAEAEMGETATQRWGVAPLTVGDDDEWEAFALGLQTLTDTNTAGYGEINYNITNNLQVTGGVRVSRVTFSYLYYDYGPLSASDTPTVANGGITLASAASTPVTPKGELTYRFTPTKLVYLLADEGFRPGGGNAQQAASICGKGAAEYGVTVAAAPSSYGPDTDWNYEAGTKDLVANGRVQLNADVYHILWKGVQLKSSFPGCGTSFITNAGQAASNGVEFSSQAIVLRALQMNLAVGFDHSYYVSEAIAIPGAPGFPSLVAASAGQNFAVPRWTGDIGARLDLGSAFRMGASYDPYIRADLRGASSYEQTSGYPASGYTPFGNSVPPNINLDLHAGLDIGHLDVNLYALNALNNNNGIKSGGPSGCSNAACTVYTTYSPITSVNPFKPPITVGVQLSYTD